MASKRQQKGTGSKAPEAEECDISLDIILSSTLRIDDQVVRYSLAILIDRIADLIESKGPFGQGRLPGPARKPTRRVKPRPKR